MFGARLRALRKARGLKGPGVAARIGVTRAALSNWEQGVSRPTAENLAALCREYKADDATLGELMRVLDEERVAREAATGAS